MNHIQVMPQVFLVGEQRLLVAELVGEPPAPLPAHRRAEERVGRQAEDRVASAEDLSDDELEALHDELRARADAACETLDNRKAAKSKKAS